jgi:pimeloyl-ACP methyl ester carboxylesterase
VPLIDVHGRQLRYREVGAGRPGTPVLLVHGAGASSAVWLELMPRLARGRRVVAVDLPGHGMSAGGVRSIEEMRDAVGMAAAALRLGRSILVGHSMGGLVVLAAALEWPDKVAGLGLVATAARLKVSEPGVLVPLQTQFERWPALVAEVAYSPETPADVRRRGAGVLCSASQEQTLTDFRATAAYDARARLGEIHAPALVVTCEHDLMTPARWGEALAAGLAGEGARLCSIARCGHAPMHERPDELASALRDFIDAIP